MLAQNPAGAYQLCPHEEAAKECPAVTLEVRLDIIPKGDTSIRRTIYTVKISQVDDQDRSDDFRDYDYEIFLKPHHMTESQTGHVIGRGKVEGHRRGDLALELVRRVLENHILGV